MTKPQKLEDQIIEISGLVSAIQHIHTENEAIIALTNILDQKIKHLQSSF